ncbi:copia-like retroelement pol polyprotein [Cucumis melo var. makuwa]|uniref:Copia-like retroelement pol polyprotein n=1 Tax=Cucumis melo var. makuwa TaxID=1194695 RepID=A0A5D3BYJ7_CUCMM|nr:copia-like retroelement pol polyprotein [Cucumis melo var. makuwa]
MSGMEAFLMSLDMRSWRAVISEWEYPTEKDEAGQTIRKSELKWTKDEDDVVVAWDILEVAFEGISKVKISRLQIWTSRFEALQMGEDETIAKFNVRVLDIANESDALGEKMSDSKLVRMVLRSLPSKFNMKEANDPSKMKLDELFGSLQTFEIHLGHTASRRKLGLALSNNSGDWYFDSGCSRHMTDNADFFSEPSECKVGLVVFEDGGKGKIIGKRTINRPGLPFLLDVRIVQGLSANLISISQLCYQGYQVSFSKDRCNVLDSQKKVFLSGTRLSDNCYHWDAEVNLCNISKVEEAELWHKRLGHFSGTTISKVTKADVIIGLPPLSFSSLESCSECPAGIFHEFFAPLTPKKNGVVERRNRTLQEMVRVIIHAKHLPIQFWAEALNTVCHIHNRVILHPGITTTSYELWKGRKPNVNRAYRVYNQHTKTVMESVNVIIDGLGKEPNRNFDDEDEAFWDSLSHKPADAESESTSLTRETTYSPPHTEPNRIDMATPSTSVNHSKTFEGEATVSAS